MATLADYKQYGKYLVTVIAPSYWLLLTIIYTYSYWSKFRVNVFEYISIADLLQASIGPITSSFAGSLVGLLLGTASREFARMKGFLILASILLASFLVNIQFGIALIIIYFYLYISKRPEFFQKALHDEDAHGFVIAILLFVIPLFVFMNNDARANSILRGNGDSYVIMDEVKYDYVGKLGENIFLASRDPDTIKIISLAEIGSIDIVKSKGFAHTQPNFMRWWLPTPDELSKPEQKTHNMSGKSKNEGAGS